MPREVVRVERVAGEDFVNVWASAVRRHGRRLHEYADLKREEVNNILVEVVWLKCT